LRFPNHSRRIEADLKQIEAGMRFCAGETRGVNIKFYTFYFALFCLAFRGGLAVTPAFAGGREGIPGEGIPAAITLQNGLRVLMRERHVTPLVAIDLWVRAGAREETGEEAGSAHFLEHVLFKGTATRGVGQADSDIENLGATLNAATGPDYAHFYTTVAASRAPQALAILADVARNATLPDAEVERERGVILDELAQHDSSDMARAVDILYAKAFPSLPYGRSPGGATETIRLRGRDTLAAFYRRAYRPERCALVLIGDLTPAQGQTWARQAFGTWTSPDPAVATPKISSEQRNIQQNIFPSGVEKTAALPLKAVPLLPGRIAESGSGRNRVIGLAFPAPSASDAPMTAAALLTAEILGSAQGGGRLASPVFAGTEATARFTPRRDGSLWMLTATGREEGGAGRQGDREPGKPGEEASASLIRLETALRSVADGLRRNPPNGAEVLTARQRLLGRLDAESETNAGLAQAVGYADCVGGDAPETLRQRLQQITPADVQQFLARYLLSQPGLTVYAGAGSSLQADRR
jgi:predicted Zn-dependent peptidase